MLRADGVNDPLLGTPYYKQALAQFLKRQEGLIECQFIGNYKVIIKKLKRQPVAALEHSVIVEHEIFAGRSTKQIDEGFTRLEKIVGDLPVGKSVWLAGLHEAAGYIERVGDTAENRYYQKKLQAFIDKHKGVVRVEFDADNTTKTKVTRIK